MELTETYTLPVSQQRAWEALNDTEILRVSIPGCDAIEAEGEHVYALSMSASIGPVKARFKGRMRLTEVDAPRSYTIVFESQGSSSGPGSSSGSAHVTLERDGDASTKLSYTASAQIGGRFAQIGSRLIDGAAKKLAGQFFRRFSAQVSGEASTSASASSATDARVDDDA